MAITLVDDTASISTTEYSIIGDTTSGVPLSNTTDVIGQIKIRLSAMAAGDEYRIRAYETVGGVQGVVYDVSRFGAQSETILVIPSLIYGNGYDVTVIKVAGTDRTIGWSYCTVA